MATQPAPSDPTTPIDPTLPDELIPVIAPEPPPANPDGFPEIAPDDDVPDRALPEWPEL
ncbi:hypothetical protein [Novosphingobium aerophilum]|uniref:Uncharacterized protein n=1 Tax=Novosphingobium aerophilum TaxID=2839843 RepID=A0A7X1F5Z7_9SPHN|nr:hypothetical protein [Novosphingobium aerophilum]MBC2651046.1 hypothetical protein [Novosphingobium aerophilum]